MIAFMVSFKPVSFAAEKSMFAVSRPPSASSRLAFDTGSCIVLSRPSVPASTDTKLAKPQSKNLAAFSKRYSPFTLFS